ncbi:hypothetical protein Noc_1892 [Nitrosococcus oceani ATCC 19707]|uniref:Uncharacterized protein n=2 Tax=Nitrosococcus oceani TaxID=1229 RepID=Q3J9Y8_NITOC|nr:hypothetical protein [Nitrosococcus oceani]ABA58358.1 hypothetical protein Noc_1892 [Nitrosococcus oceani ATCC 19707]EDZ67850.1 hypothetical protein NOC27_1177 [Nitrosococcus oceani AFC27]KFI19161.1 hypothetical protein IB75_10075 [Nitrosococcus oceani C-27]
MCESNKINIVVLGDFNRDLLLLPGLSEEKDTKRSFRWYGGSILLADLSKHALNQERKTQIKAQIKKYYPIKTCHLKKKILKDYWENWIKGKESCDEYITLLELFPKDEKSKDSSVYRIRKVIGRLNKDVIQNKDQKNILGDLTRKLVKEKTGKSKRPSV